MTTLLQDLRYGLRMLAKAPVVSAVAALSLGLGIAANATMFAILNAFMFEPLPYRDQDSLILIGMNRPGESVDDLNGLSIADFRDIEEAAGGLDAAMIYTIEPANLTGMDVPEQLQVVPATPNVFDVLGVQPVFGRGFRPEEGTEGLGNVLVLEHDFWQRRFLGDPDVLGRTMTLDGRSYTIVGVMPETFDMIPANVHAILPTDFASQRENRSNREYITFGRLARGATPASVERELSGLSARLAGENPDTNRGLAIRVFGARDFFPGPTDTKLTQILTAVALFGLLIACANVANLLLSRAEERQKEVAVRTALGAGRHRILRQLLTESMTLGVIAGVVGLGLSVLVVRWLQGMLPGELPKAMIPELDPEVVAATMVVAILAGVVFGLAPALHAARADLREALGEGSRGGTASRSRRRLRNAFVMGEFAVALALLTGTGFMLEVFQKLTSTDPGYRQEGLLTFSLTAQEDRFPGPAELGVYEDELLARLASVPGVRGVAAMSSLPRGRGNPSTPYAVEGRPAPAEGEAPMAGMQAVSPDYFRTMEISIHEGRGVETTDRAESQPVVVVSQALVDREFPGEDPLGKTLTIRGESRVIVGVVENIKQERISLATDRGEAFYVPLAQQPPRQLSFALRTDGDPTALAADARQAVWAVNPDQPVADVQTLDAFVAESLAGPRSIYDFMLTMAVIAIALAAMGIYGVMSHAVAQQRREIGVRMALGAGRGAVVGMVTRTGITLVGAGMLLGLPLSYLMYRGVVSALGLFVGRLGLNYAGAVTVVLATVAVLSTWIPARRASGVEPAAALRDI